MQKIPIKLHVCPKCKRNRIYLCDRIDQKYLIIPKIIINYKGDIINKKIPCVCKYCQQKLWYYPKDKRVSRRIKNVKLTVK